MSCSPFMRLCTRTTEFGVGDTLTASPSRAKNPWSSATHNGRFAPPGNVITRTGITRVGDCATALAAASNRRDERPHSRMIMSRLPQSALRGTLTGSMSVTIAVLTAPLKRTDAPGPRSNFCAPSLGERPKALLE